MDAIDVLHRDEVVVLDFAELVDVHDVRVRELRGELGLAEEHLDEVGRVREVRQDPLDRDPPVEALEAALLREEHLGHAAARDPPQQHVMTEVDASFGGHVDIMRGSS